jgi:hypothetical protein
MTDATVRRLRADLDAMEDATGLRLPFGWPDVWLSLALVPCGAALAAWAELGPPGMPAWGLVPLLLVALVAAIRWSVRRRNLERKRPKRAAEILAGLVAAAALPALVLWERGLALPAGVARGAGCFMLGVMCVPLAFSARGRRPALAVTASLAPYGLALPLLPQDQWTLPGGAAVAVFGFVAAAILAWQLRAEGESRGATNRL